MKKLLALIVIVLIGFVFIGCTQQPEEIIDGLDEITSDTTVYIRTLNPIQEAYFIRNGNVYIHEFSGDMLLSAKLLDNGIIELIFTDGTLIYVNNYLSFEVTYEHQ